MALPTSLPILSIIIFLPLSGAIALLFIRSANQIKWLSLSICALDLLLTILLIHDFDPSSYEHAIW